MDAPALKSEDSSDDSVSKPMETESSFQPVEPAPAMEAATNDSKVEPPNEDLKAVTAPPATQSRRIPAAHTT